MDFVGSKHENEAWKRSREDTQRVLKVRRGDACGFKERAEEQLQSTISVTF